MRLLSFLCSIKSVPAVGLLGKFCIQLDCVFILAGGAGKLLTCLELQCCNITLQLSFFRKDLAIVFPLFMHKQIQDVCPLSPPL